jgi:hypothetical protein
MVPGTIFTNRAMPLAVRKHFSASRRCSVACFPPIPNAGNLLALRDGGALQQRGLPL